MVGRMARVEYLTAGLALAVLLVAVAGVAFAYGRASSAAGEDGMGSMMGGRMGSMMGDQSMGGDRMMGSSGEDEPFDLRFIDQMTMHHQGAIMSSEHMIADSERPELRRLARNIQESQSEQIELMQTWREKWYGDDIGQNSGMMDPSQMNETMGDGMMGGSMRETMGGDTTDEMFLQMMISHHQLAVEMSEEALEEADHPELKELAQKIIDEQSAEIELIRGYLGEIQASERRQTR